ncbi:MAG: carboxylesterase/lipase family protein [Candidatus Binatia bacterium]
MTVVAMLPLAMAGWSNRADAVASDESPNPAIVTESGPLKGITSPSINKFLGIPYAAPPVGDLRWTPPQPYGRWHGLLKATNFGNSCPQLDPFGPTFGDEDCLFLNVYTPGLKKNQHKHNGLPVMVWIHGGGLTRLSGELEDPTPLVEKGEVILVTINYRLGVLGFFAHPALDAEGHLNANYGLMDQQFALQWVQRNIAAFGGDPNRVTIFGESAGGLSVYSHLASPTAAGLFHRAIAQSGAYDSFHSFLQRIVPLATAEVGGAALAAQVGCSDGTVQCLRAIPAATLVNAQPNDVFPIVDGTVLTQPPGAAFASGQLNRVPVITGSTRDEWRSTVARSYDYLGNPLTDAAYPQAVADFFGLPVDHPGVQFLVTVQYPLSKFPPPPGVVSGAPLALGALGTDFLFSCPGRNAARLLSQHVPTYAYEFNDENTPISLSFGLAPATFPLGSYHGAELLYLFNFTVTPALSPEQQQLSDAMISYWSQFARTGDPNVVGTPAWFPYNAVTDQFQSLVPPTPTVEFNFDAAHQCSSFWALL